MITMSFYLRGVTFFHTNKNLNKVTSFNFVGHLEIGRDGITMKNLKHNEQEGHTIIHTI